MTLHVIVLILLIGRRSNGSPRWGRSTIKMSGNFRSLPFVCESSYTADLRSYVWTERVLQTRLPTAALEGDEENHDSENTRTYMVVEKKNSTATTCPLYSMCMFIACTSPHTHAKYTDTCDKEKRWEAAVFLNYWVSSRGLGRVRNMSTNTWIL